MNTTVISAFELRSDKLALARTIGQAVRSVKVPYPFHLITIAKEGKFFVECACRFPHLVDLYNQKGYEWIKDTMQNAFIVSNKVLAEDISSSVLSALYGTELEQSDTCHVGINWISPEELERLIKMIPSGKSKCWSIGTGEITFEI